LGVTPDVVVIGGGVIGASVAYHLAARGANNVVVLDRARGPGEGSTGRATGGFRVQFSTALNVRLSLLARTQLARFGDEVGGDCGFVPAGYLWIAETQAQLAGLRVALEVQRANGVDDAVEVDAAELAALNPALQRSGIAGGTYCPSDGFLRPLQVLDGYRVAAQRHGARFRYGSEVVGVRRGRDGRVAAVRTLHDEIATGSVVDAAGAWAASVARLAGVELAVAPLRRQVATTVPTRALPAHMPMTLYAGDGFHLRVRDGRVLLLLPAPGAPDPFDDAVDPAWIDAVTALARRRLPCLAGVAIDRPACWAGLYEMTPDGHAIVGAAPAVPNLYFATGASGHGVMHAPALGRLLAEIMLDGAAFSLADVSGLRPDRFASKAAPVQIDQV
jgi:glycine/D-amino acid oxidase-like deaminating enzyme